MTYDAAETLRMWRDRLGRARRFLTLRADGLVETTLTASSRRR
jgi:hypothetical protein